MRRATHLHHAPAPTARPGAAPRSRADAGDVPVLRCRPGSPPERFARVLGDPHPVVTFFVAALAGLAVLSVCSVALALLVVHVLVGPLGLGGPDNSFIRTLADHRTAGVTEASEIGSQLAGGSVLPAVVGTVGLAAAVTRQWRVAGFAVFVLIVESAAYRMTSLAVPRDRPDVQRLDSLPADASFPSGHTAAAISVYVGLVLLLTSRVTNRAARAFAWTFAILMTTFVAFSRMYRGMHHPLDVAGGVAVGIGAVVVMLFVVRAAGAAHDDRQAMKARA